MLLSKVSANKAFVGGALCRPTRAVQPTRVARLEVVAEGERLRLHNLGPQKGSRRDEKRKGRGYGGHQGGTCGFGTRGQKSRSGSSVRPGFEGGQIPLYRRLPKLRGIAGGMPSGLPSYNVVNLSDLDQAFESGAVVDLAAIEAKNLLNISGRDKKLPLKVLADGELSKPLVIKAAKFSDAAMEKIQAAGATAEVLPGRQKWTRKAHERAVREMEKKGLNYKAEMAKKKAAAMKRKKAAAAAATPSK